jgi:predicted  nucleic acid-binding Zn-ribbon protein
VQHLRTELSKSHSTARQDVKTTEKKQLRFEDLSRNVERAEQLVEKIKKKLHALRESMDLDETATCVVQGALNSSVRFWKADEEIVPVADYTQVQFVMRQSRGTHFVALVEKELAS